MRLESLNAATMIDISNSAKHLVHKQPFPASNFRGNQNAFHGQHTRGNIGHFYSGGRNHS